MLASVWFGSAKLATVAFRSPAVRNLSSDSLEGWKSKEVQLKNSIMIGKCTHVCGFKYIHVPTLIISSREYKYWENSPKSVPGNNSYQPSGTDSSPQWASSQGTFFQQAFGTRDPPFSLAIFGMLEAFDTWSMPLKPSKQPKNPTFSKLTMG